MIRKSFFAVRQWGTRYVYSTQLGKSAYKSVSYAKVKRRSLSRVFSKWFGKANRVATDDTTQSLVPFESYKQNFGDVPGWFLDEAQALWDCLLSFQNNSSIDGNLLEIGVWKGKSAALLSLHSRPEETCVWVDRMLLAEFKELIRSARNEKNLFLEMSSDTLLENEQVKEFANSFRWIHIDGEHSGQAVTKDLLIADQLLADEGIICVDDFPSCAYPQINFAVIEFLHDHPALTMFACGHNKGYICRRPSEKRYMEFFKDELQAEMKTRGASVTLWKSGRPADWNCFGITDRVEMFDYRGPDWNPGKIEI